MKEKRQQMIKGLSVSPGIGIGKVQLITIEAIQFPKFWIADREIHQEISRFRQALKKSLQSLMRIKEKVCRFQIGDQIQILETHQMIMNDALMIQGTVDIIRQEKINAEWAFDKTVQKLKASFPEESNSYFRERYNEISHVARRILMNLSNIEKTSTTLFKKDSIIVAHDLSPAETVQMFKGMVRGFVTETGGIDSHAAIVARALEIPAIVGLDGITHRVQDGQLVLVDGSQGI
ncbi:MAG: phosphoenolpyruvate--protein phosphotransferase, partial [Deltaproteobacteria bacterium]|nr:phosphoenolpyruvate--protein phosphotransferase [Deltaproteobacteria bacterium]